MKVPGVLLYGTSFRFRRNPNRPAVIKGIPVPTRLELCKADAVAAGSALRVESGDLQLAVFNVEGEYFVTDDCCTHGPGLLSEGYIDGDVVECNFHNGQF